MNFNQHLKEYDKNGFLLVKKLITKKDCLLLKDKISKLKSKLNISFSGVPYGFGDLKDSLLKKIKNREKFSLIANQLCKAELSLGHFLIVNKASWLGPDVEWHQEVFNSDVYAPGINMRQNWKRFIQVFIAIDDHDKVNGCLKVFKGSHRAGILPFEDFVNNNGSHKRRVKPKYLDKLHKKFKIIDIEMKKGDVLFFNHLLVHGSPTNMSPKSRVSGLMQFYDSNLKYDYRVFKNYQNFRARFIKNHSLGIISKLSSYKNNLKIFSKN